MESDKWLIKQGALLTVVALFLSIFSFAKETIFAAYFGVSEIADAYTTAIQIPEIIFSFVWEAIHAVVIPIYTEQLEKYGRRAGHNFIRNTIGLIGIFSVIVIVLCTSFSDLIIKLFSPGLNRTTHDMAVSLLRWIIPMMMFEGIIRICQAILNVQKEFVVPKILQSVRNIVSFIAIVLFAKKFGVYAAAVGMLTGMCIECLITYVKTCKYEKLGIGFDFKNDSIIKAKKMALPIIISIGAMDINQIVDKIVASYLASGSIVALSYASKLSGIIRTLLIDSIITVVYPSYSRYSAKGESDNLKKIFATSLEYILLLCIPLIVGGSILRNEIIALVFERGAFDSTSTSLVARIFACYLCGIMFVSIRNIAIRLYTASYDTKTVTINTIVGVGLNIALNLILVQFMGVVGLALATTISMACVGIRLLYLVNKKLFSIRYGNVLVTALKTCLASILMGAFLFIAQKVVDSTSFNSWQLLVYSVCVIVVGGLVYLETQYLLNTNHVRELVSMLKRVMKRKS